MTLPITIFFFLWIFLWIFFWAYSGYEIFILIKKIKNGQKSIGNILSLVFFVLFFLFMTYSFIHSYMAGYY